MIRFVTLIALCLAVAACGIEVQRRPVSGSGSGGGGVDQGSPTALANAIFAAAKSGNLDGLASIVDEHSDQEAKDIGNVSRTDAEFQAMFRKHFANGRVVGEPFLDDDGGAYVAIEYGKAGDKEKLLVMSKEGNKWMFRRLIDAVDQSSPAALADSVFQAARTGIFSGMRGVAAKDAEEEIQQIARVSTEPAEFQKMFREHFANGKVDGEAMIKDNEAMVPILFGPRADKKEVLRMVRVGEKWYLRAM